MKARDYETDLPVDRPHQEDKDFFVERVGREMERLPQGDWEILFLRVVGDMRYEEIAKALAIPVETVGRRIRQVRESMRSRLFPESEAAELPGFRSP